ncbi:MAG: GGDEF domain-containing protein [Desulfobacterales bacterium]|nr:GGDEF domain-containing protein [Desulfobacterales bacterium]
MPDKKLVLPLLVPAAVIFAAAAILWQWPQMTPRSTEIRALMVLLPVLPFALFVLVAATGLRYGNAGLLLSALALALCYAFVGSPGPDLLKGHPAKSAALLLLPLNIGVFSTLMRRRLKTAVGIGCLLALIFQAVGVLWLSGRLASSVDASVSRIVSGAAPDLGATLEAAGGALASTFSVSGGTISVAAAICFAAVALFLLVRFFLRRNALTAGLAGALAAAFLSGSGEASAMAPTVYYTAAGLILAAAGIESSFTLAYTDELTGLPGRRRLNEELINLGKRYSLAMIDVDHFKKFNDRYGHDAGDQVLQMIGKKLAGLGGGGRAFRYGGEEFTAVFPGKEVDEALPYLERYRRQVAANGFVVRGKQRKKSGPESRKAPPNRKKAVQVTVSIGLAGLKKGVTDPVRVLKLADQALYRAKNAGRNRIRTDEGGD